MTDSEIKQDLVKSESTSTYLLPPEVNFNQHLLVTLLFYQIELLKNKPFLVLPFSLSRDLSAPKTKKFFEFL